MATRYRIILTTYSKDRTGTRLIKALLDARLAACVQVLPIRSFYCWKGRTARARERLMLIKAKARDFDAIQRVIAKIHDYDVPEVVSVRIDRGSSAYLRWLERVTR